MKPNQHTKQIQLPQTEEEIRRALDKYEQLKKILANINSAIVAFSGGCDSTFLLQTAKEILGNRVIALTAISPSLPEWEREETKLLAKQLGVKHIFVQSRELDNPNYRKNPQNRCFFCKDELYNLAINEAKKLNIPTIMDGTNADDLGDYRPGLQAAKKYSIRSPLAEAKLTKKEIRYLSKLSGLPTWDKPATPCLASRFPYGTEITLERLKKIERCEKKLRELGFSNFRARYHFPILRIELSPEEFPKILEPKIRQSITKTAKQEGFLYTALDLEGYQTGSLNRELPEEREKN